MKHIVLHPVEAPAFELDLVLLMPTPGLASLRGMRCGQYMAIPMAMRKSCAPGSIRVASVTPTDVPCRVRGNVQNGRVVVFADGEKPFPSAVWVHLIGRARTSPPAWERHSRQQYTRNQRVFAKALP